MGTYTVYSFTVLIVTDYFTADVQYLLTFTVKSPVDMTGLSRRSATRGTEQLHSELKRPKRGEVLCVTEVLKSLCKCEDRLVSASHDT